MVSADNLNFDCLELIFAYLAGNDLVAVSLVSRSFLSAVTPRLYRTLTFGLRQAKRYPSIISPFAAINAHHQLATHVRHIDIRAVPTVKFSPQPKFVADCMRAIGLSQNLGSFTCTLEVVTSFLPSLKDKPSLESLRCIANFTTDQTSQAVKIQGLRSLTLDSGSWNVVDALPDWSTALTPSLTSLTLTNMPTLSVEIMESTLPNLPSLDCLHILGCPKIDQSSMLRLLVHTPQLQSLAFTSYESARQLPTTVTPLVNLRHLAIETQSVTTPGSSSPAFWVMMINMTRTWSCPLKSIAFKLPDKIVLADVVVNNLVSSHRATLTHLALRNLSLSREGAFEVFRECTELETIKLSLPNKDIHTFAQALSHAKRVHTITDMGDVHGPSSQRAPIQKTEIRALMAHQDSVEKIIADGRTWTV
ncbi:uncharacterized protein BXZ73DRAFT_48619 [Epithele typhae]|uniref:uncharacterized protein n=1 Tax=Epithele typhae TaxID=378194 RepID=UPI00200734FF|nr:uncharacterized protein BXZ73DRAFT_48619 [Epithele typhae]KAH9927980.1 hypothetical protein BXZ73DRAFT_48619 [Epithele typhae]